MSPLRTGGRAAGLDLPDEHGLLGDVVLLNVLVSRALDEAVAPSGISVADYLVLAVVRRSPGHRSAPTAICDVLGRTTGGMSLTLDRLESAGWIRRLPDPSDRRRVVVEATPAGRALAVEVSERLHRWEAGLGIGPAERDGIGRALADLSGAIEAGLGQPASPV